MSETNWGKAIFGGLIGMVLGVFVGVHRVMEEVTASAPPPLDSTGQPAAVGWDPTVFLHSHRFWIPVIICTLVFSFMSGRIGRPTSQSDL
jgi:hypothetical protein